MEVSATERKCLDTTRQKRARMGEASSENGRGLATCRRNEMDRRCGCGTALNLPSQRHQQNGQALARVPSGTTGYHRLPQRLRKMYGENLNFR